jgi:3-oxoacyl-ACP reductase-like protein
LALRLEHHYRNRTWADRSRWRLEDRLNEVLDHVDSLARAEIERQREAHEKGLRDLEAWEAGAAAARRAYVAALNRRRMRNQAARSGRADALRAYAARIRGAVAAEANDALASQIREWEAQVLAEAERMDPLNSLADLRSIEPEQIKASDLAPYMPRGMRIHYRPVVPPFPVPVPVLPSEQVLGIRRISINP